MGWSSNLTPVQESVAQIETDLANVAATVAVIEPNTDVETSSRATPADVATEAAGKGLKRIVSAPVTGGFTIPSLATGITVASAAAAWTYGAWVQMLAAQAFDYYLRAFWLNGIGATAVQVQLGLGPAASEVGIDAFMTQQISNEYASGNLDPFVFVPSGARLAARTADAQVATQNHRLTLHAVRATDLEALP